MGNISKITKESIFYSIIIHSDSYKNQINFYKSYVLIKIHFLYY